MTPRRSHMYFRAQSAASPKLSFKVCPPFFWPLACSLCAPPHTHMEVLINRRVELLRDLMWCNYGKFAEGEKASELMVVAQV